VRSPVSKDPTKFPLHWTDGRLKTIQSDVIVSTFKVFRLNLFPTELIAVRNAEKERRETGKKRELPELNGNLYALHTKQLSLASGATDHSHFIY
jgi:hypothetical protein